MIEKLKELILCINAAIDSGQNNSITIHDISVEISTENIFEFLKTKLKSSRKFNDTILSSEEKNQLICHWQFLVQSGSAYQLSAENSGLCFLLALAVISIQSQL